MKESYRERKIEFMQLIYGKKAEEWKDMHDDRRVYANTYRMILEALESLPEEPNNYVCVAMNRMIGEDRELMDKILEHFKDR